MTEAATKTTPKRNTGKNGKTKRFSPQTYILEGLLAEQLNQYLQALDALHEFDEEAEKDKPDDAIKFTRLDIAKATYVLFRQHTNHALGFFDERNGNAYRTKHRAVRDVLQAMLKRLEDNDPTTQDIENSELQTNMAWIQFIRDATEFMEAFHYCLHEDTNPAKREAVAALFIEESTPD